MSDFIYVVLCRRARFAIAMLLIALAGCGSVPAEYFYTMSATALAATAPAGATNWDAGITVEVATIPESVDRPQLVISAGENQVVILEQQRWAEPLKGQIARTVAVNLSRLIGAARVSAYPHAADTDAMFRITLDVQRFEARRGDAVAVEVLWTIRGADGPALASGRTVARETIGAEGYDELVGAHSRAFGAVSRDIAAALQSASVQRR